MSLGLKVSLQYKVAIATFIAFATIRVFSMNSESVRKISIPYNSVQQNRRILSY